MEARNLPVTEFKIKVIRMLNEFIERRDAHNENLNNIKKDIETIKMTRQK